LELEAESVRAFKDALLMWGEETTLSWPRDLAQELRGSRALELAGSLTAVELLLNFTDFTVF